jgi:hypothetical protein
VGITILIEVVGLKKTEEEEWKMSWLFRVHFNPLCVDSQRKLASLFCRLIIITNLLFLKSFCFESLSCGCLGGSLAGWLGFCSLADLRFFFARRLFFLVRKIAGGWVGRWVIQENKKNRIRVSKFFWLRCCCGVEILLGLFVGWLV